MNNTPNKDSVEESVEKLKPTVSPTIITEKDDLAKIDIMQIIADKMWEAQKPAIQSLLSQTRTEAIKECIDELESNPNPDGSISPNIQHWIERKKIQLKKKL